VNDIVRDLITLKLDDFVRRFEIRGWEGPSYTAPEETIAYYARFGLNPGPVWEVWCQLPDSPASEDPQRLGEPTRASVRFTDSDLTKMDVPAIATKLTMALLGRSVHETLEWAKLDGEWILDPHEQETLQQTADNVRSYLIKAGPRKPRI
jgi:hypothetical protein